MWVFTRVCVCVCACVWSLHQVFDWESLGRDRFLGRVVLPLNLPPNTYVRFVCVCLSVCLSVTHT